MLSLKASCIYVIAVSVLAAFYFAKEDVLNHGYLKTCKQNILDKWFRPSVTSFMVLSTDQLSVTFLARRLNITKSTKNLNKTSIKTTQLQENSWYCPTIEELSTKPNRSSCPAAPIHQGDPNSSLMAIWDILGGGPSAQNLGFRHILMAAVITKKSVLLSPFVQHHW